MKKELRCPSKEEGGVNHDIHMLNESIMPREVSQSEHGKSCMITDVWDT